MLMGKYLAEPYGESYAASLEQQSATTKYFHILRI
jgi:hypothetical protein